MQKEQTSLMDQWEIRALKRQVSTEVSARIRVEAQRDELLAAVKDRDTRSRKHWTNQRSVIVRRNRQGGRGRKVNMNELDYHAGETDYLFDEENQTETESLRDDGRSDGYGESLAERNV